MYACFPSSCVLLHLFAVIAKLLPPLALLLVVSLSHTCGLFLTVHSRRYFFFFSAPGAGPIPPQLGELSALTELTIGRNRLAGTNKKSRPGCYDQRTKQTPLVQQQWAGGKHLIVVALDGSMSVIIAYAQKQRVPQTGTPMIMFLGYILIIF